MNIFKTAIILLSLWASIIGLAHAGQENCDSNLASLIDHHLEDTAKTPILAQEGSLSNLIPDFKEFQDSMLAKRPSINKFQKNYLKNNNVEPTLRQALDFHIQAKDDLAAHLRSGKNGNRELDHYLEQAARDIENTSAIFEKFEEIKLNKSDILTRNFNQLDPQQRKLINKFGIYNYKGPLGELSALLRLKGVIAQTVFFKNMQTPHKGTQKINNLLNHAVLKRFKEIDHTHHLDLIKKYPHVFKGDIAKYSPEELIERGMNFILTKELDVVIEQDGKFIVIEVKNYKGGLGASAVKKHRKGKKSIEDQIFENKQIFQFLGIDDKFKIGFLSIQGMSVDAKKIIENTGAIVFDKVDKLERH